MSSAASNDTDAAGLAFAASISLSLPLLPQVSGKWEVMMFILYCGVCYADVVWTRNKYGHSKYPSVPGYCFTIPEIIPLNLQDLCYLLYIPMIRHGMNQAEKARSSAVKQAEPSPS